MTWLDDGTLRMSASWGAREFEYVLRFEKRRDLLITVYPSLHVEVAAPHLKSVEEVVGRVRARRSWIARRLREFEDQPCVNPHQFVPGESFLYLGRQYRLRIERAGSGVAIHRGRLVAKVGQNAAVADIRSAVVGWYLQRARVVFADRAARLQRSISLVSGLRWSLRIQRMLRRWGSCTSRGTITLNPLLLQAPPSCVDYVIVHELLHLREPRHSTQFYRLLRRALPDWERRKQTLERSATRSWD